MEFNGSFKIDFKEARERAGFKLPEVEAALNSLPGYKLDLNSIENNNMKISEEQVNTLMGVYGLPIEQKKGYYEKYTNL